MVTRTDDRMLRSALTLVLALTISACAHNYVDVDGTRNVIGLVWARMPPADNRGAESLRVRSLGVSVTTTPVGSAVVLGYSDSNVVLVRDHQFVNAAPLLDPPR